MIKSALAGVDRRPLIGPPGSPPPTAALRAHAGALEPAVRGHGGPGLRALQPRIQPRLELYLAGSEAAFASGVLELFQIVFAPAETAGPYWTRAEVYSGAQADEWFASTR